MKVRALGERNKWIGYYNHRRIRGGDVFELVPILTIKAVNEKGEPDKKGKKRMKVTLSAESQFNPKWMEKVAPDAPISKPATSNDLGNNRPRPEMSPGGDGEVI